MEHFILFFNLKSHKTYQKVGEKSYQKAALGGTYEAVDRFPFVIFRAGHFRLSITHIYGSTVLLITFSLYQQDISMIRNRSTDSLNIKRFSKLLLLLHMYHPAYSYTLYKKRQCKIVLSYYEKYLSEINIE